MEDLTEQDMFIIFQEWNHNGYLSICISEPNIRRGGKVMKLTEETYINLAEKVINELSRSKKIVRGREQPIKLITTSKIRNLLV